MFDYELHLVIHRRPREVWAFYADVQNMGGNRWDTSSLIARLTGRKPGPS